MVTLEQVAAALGRRAENLLVLDRRPLRLAFLQEIYETVVVRDLLSGATVELTLDPATGERVDPAELRARDRALTERLGGPLSPRLRDLVLRHPDLEPIHVAVTREGDAEPTSLRLSVREVVALARDTGVARIELLVEPEILD